MYYFSTATQDSAQMQPSLFTTRLSRGCLLKMLWEQQMSFIKTN